MPFVGSLISDSIYNKAPGNVCKDSSEEGEEIKIKIKLADIVFEIHGQYAYLKEYCRDYLTDKESEIQIEVTENDILAEFQDMESNNFSFPYLETLAVLRKIADFMPERNRFLMHGAALSWKNNGFMFTAPSGTGKSTHIALWKRYLGEEIKIINGDKPILQITENEVQIYGTPWAGKEQWQSNANVPLKGICLLQRGKENHIRQIRPVEALSQLMQQVYYTSDVGMAAKTMELLNQVFAQVPVYQMECNISEEAMRCSFNEMRKVCERK